MCHCSATYFVLLVLMYVHDIVYMNVLPLHTVMTAFVNTVPVSLFHGKVFEVIKKVMAHNTNVPRMSSCK